GCLILHYKCDKYLEAEALLRQALDIASANFGEKHALTAGCYGELAEVLNLQQRYADAAAAARKSIDIHEACGAKDPKAPKAYEALATALECQGHYEQAALLRRKAVTMFEQTADNHPETIRARIELAVNLQAMNRVAESEVLLQTAARQAETTLTLV